MTVDTRVEVLSVTVFRVEQDILKVFALDIDDAKFCTDLVTHVLHMCTTIFGRTESGVDVTGDDIDALIDNQFHGEGRVQSAAEQRDGFMFV